MQRPLELKKIGQILQRMVSCLKIGVNLQDGKEGVKITCQDESDRN